MKFMYIIGIYDGILGNENEVYSIYYSITETFKRIPLNYILLVKIAFGVFE